MNTPHLSQGGHPPHTCMAECAKVQLTKRESYGPIDKPRMDAAQAKIDEAIASPYIIYLTDWDHPSECYREVWFQRSYRPPVGGAHGVPTWRVLYFLVSGCARTARELEKVVKKGD